MDCGTEIRVHDKLTRGWSSEATRLPGLFTAGADVMSTWRGKKLDPCLTVHTRLTQNGCSETGRDLGPFATGLIPGPTSPRATKKLQGTNRNCMHVWLGARYGQQDTKRPKHSCQCKSEPCPPSLHTAPATGGQAIEATLQAKPPICPHPHPI